MHLIAVDCSKKAVFVVGANGNKISAELGIIVSFEADGAAVVQVRVVGHGGGLRISCIHAGARL